MLKDELQKLIFNSVKNAYPKTKILLADIELENAKNTEFGDLASNIGFKLAKEQKLLPQEVASKLAELIRTNWPKHLSQIIYSSHQLGYINFSYNYSFYVKQILEEGQCFGNLELLQNKKIQIEFISANPTGPLTLANGRGGFGGDVLANLYKKAGAQAEREYLVNDGGNQVKILGDSVLIAAGLMSEKEDSYRGEYIEAWVKENSETIKEFQGDSKQLGQKVAKDILDSQIKKSIEKMNINFDNWFSEQSLIESGEVNKALSDFEKKGRSYKKDGALWFKTTDFGDDKDRVLVKADGENTYFANDAAYHWDKFAVRGFDKVVNFWGADHHGYIGRMQAATEAMGFKDQLEIVIMQLVRLIQNGKEVRMSKRKGTYITMDELLDLIGGTEQEASDVARFFFLSRSFNTHMDFDLDLAREHSEKNPVFYVKYAYARLSGILKNAEKMNLPQANLELLQHEKEVDLIRELIKLPELIGAIIEDKNYPVHLLTFYAQNLASKFHSFYDQCRVIDEKDFELTAARLKLVEATKIVLGITMKDLIGIDTPEKM
ncbi:MAG: arginine--tRNA ligase [bacterium]